MSDLHLEAVRHPDAYRPRCASFDVLVVAGDVLHGRAQAVATVARLAGGKLCVFVLGNHELWHRELGAERAAAKRAAARHGGSFPLTPLVLLCHILDLAMSLNFQATWASRQRADEGAREAASDGGDGCRDVALRPQRRRVAGSLGVSAGGAIQSGVKRR